MVNACQLEEANFAVERSGSLLDVLLIRFMKNTFFLMSDY